MLLVQLRIAIATNLRVAISQNQSWLWKNSENKKF
jgi:hypothetical protein